MIMTRLKPAIVLLALSAAGCLPTPPEEAAPADKTPLFTAPAFTLTDQDGQSFSSDQLKGKTWIATLFYTTCPGPCPMMSNRLRKIQSAVPDPDMMLVSFSVDPNHDTPAALKDYSRNMSADPKRWVFLTGTPDAMYDVTNKGLNLGYEPAVGDGQITHSTKFLLIDKAGQVRVVYATDDDESMKKLEADARKLAAS